MNIQQALNQSLIAGATSAYFTGQTIEQGKQSAINEYQAAANERTESEKQYQTSENIHSDYMDEQKEMLDNEVKNNNLTQAEADERLNKLNKFAFKLKSAYERDNIAQKRLKSADRKLNKWVMNKDDANSYRKIGEYDYWNMMLNLPYDMDVARAEAKALRSLTQQQETATNTTKELNKRFDGLHSGTYKSRMHQPSVRMEE